MEFGAFSDVTVVTVGEHGPHWASQILRNSQRTYVPHTTMSMNIFEAIGRTTTGGPGG
jgi:hypothetical protein